MQHHLFSIVHNIYIYIYINYSFVVLTFLSVVTYVNMCARYLFIVSRTNEKARLLENVKNVFNFKSRLQSTTEVEMNRK